MLTKLTRILSFLFLTSVPMYASPISSVNHPDLRVRFLKPIPMNAESTYDLGALPDSPLTEVFVLEITNLGRRAPISIGNLALTMPPASPANGFLVNPPPRSVSIAPGESLQVRGEIYEDLVQPDTATKVTIEPHGYKMNLCFDHNLGTHCTTLLGKTSNDQLVDSADLSYEPGVPYFYDQDQARYVYLTGSHTWDNFQDWGDSRPGFDFEAYLDLLEAHNHNYIRLWVWEGRSVGDVVWPSENINPLPWPESNGLFDLYDGAFTGGLPDGPFDPDLVRFNSAYFERLAARVTQAANRGIYVGVMLFQSFSSYEKNNGRDPWAHHPFNPANNEEGISGDLDGDGQGGDMYEIDLQCDSTTAAGVIACLQQAYVTKVLETLQNHSNVIYEIINEAEFESVDWQQEIRTFIKNTEAERNYVRHPVGLTATEGGTGHLDNVTGTWISHRGNHWATNPPAADGSKVIINDTDHIPTLLGNPTEKKYRDWVWKSATRGLNPIMMDVIQNPIGDPSRPIFNAGQILANARLSMGDAAMLMAGMPLGDLETDGDDCGEYCIYKEDTAYLSYQPNAATPVELVTGPGEYFYGWFDTRSPGQGPIASGTFQGPLENDSPPGKPAHENVLYVVQIDADVGVADVLQPADGDYVVGEKILRFAIVGLSNEGDATVFSVDATYDIRDSGGNVVQAWTASGIQTDIAPGGYEEVFLGTVDLPLEVGVFTFNVQVTGLNGDLDTNPSNNSAQSVLTMRDEPALVAEFKRGPVTLDRDVKASFSDSPSDVVSYFFDESLGSWAEHPDRPCNTGQDNPTYFKLRAFSPTFISAARFQASWDASPTVANQGILDGMNEGASFIIATDDYLFDIPQCVPGSEEHTLAGDEHWMWLELTTGGEVIERLIRFVKQ